MHGEHGERPNEIQNKEKKRMTRTLALVGLLTASFLPSVARAQQVEVLKFKDKIADAQFTSLDSTGCIRTDVFVIASNAKIKETGSTPTVEPMVNVIYSVYDLCNSLLLHSGFGSTHVIDFQLDGGLNGAHVSATVPVSDDQHGTTIYLDVTVDWTGAGDITRQRVKDHTVTPEFTVNFRIKGSFRDATATATVSDGTTNFTPPGSTVVAAGLQIVEQASVTIQRD
jgi:hypothetical protein